MFTRFFLGLGLASVSMVLSGAEFTSTDLEFFEKKIRPLLAENCYKCHSAKAKKLKGGLRLDYRAGVLKGGDSGPAIQPGKPEMSRLVEAINYDNVDLEMPPSGKLSAAHIADLNEWVKRGAPWPDEAVVGNEVKEKFNLAKRKAEHWAWQPIKKQVPPRVKQANWPTSPIDSFVLAKLEEAKLKPATEADKRTLIRRVYFDLIGLPPTSEQIDTYLKDNSPEAFTRVVDGLLASPHFGERWGRHWLDLMRYAETFGHEFDFANQEVWRYRDYVIRAFNEDVPFDRLILEHVAGDQIAPRYSLEGEWNESRLATAWWWMSQHCHSPVDVRAYQAEVIDNQIDVLSKAFQGMTIACARCHDHKFDAISTRDYYALYGLIESGSFSHGSVDGTKTFSEKRKVLQGLKAKIAGQVKVEPAPTPDKQVKPDGYQLISDISQTGGKDWFADGEAWANALTDANDFMVQGETIKPVAKGWLHSGLLSQKYQGTLRSSTFKISENHIHIAALGVDVRINVVVDNFKIIRNPIYGSLTRHIKNENPHWVTFNLGMWKGHDCYVEIVDLSNSDPAGKGSGPDAYGAVGQLWLSNNNRPPTVGLPKFDAEIKPTDVGLKNQLAEYSKIASSIARPVVVPVMLEGSGRNEKLFIRGSHKNPGAEVTRGYLTAIVGEKQPLPKGTGRMELARHIADPKNPLTSRVYVNRIWHHLFGRGIVPSTDNFGVLGEKPSHPELLDWLANRLVEKRWSTKQLIREIMLSKTYRMSSQPTDMATETKDAGNVLLHRMRVRRLQSEAIRDAILSVSGRMDKKMFGPPVAVHLTSFMEGRGRPRSGPIDGAGRRTIYQEVRRNFLSPMMLAFDMPQPLSTIGRRTSSNVPAQALIMMNDPFVVQQAQLWAKRILSTSDAVDAERLRAAYVTAFGRQPSNEEEQSAVAFLQSQAKAHGEAKPGEKAWADFCHVIFNVKEFIFLN